MKVAYIFIATKAYRIIHPKTNKIKIVFLFYLKSKLDL